MLLKQLAIWLVAVLALGCMAPATAQLQTRTIFIPLIDDDGVMMIPLQVPLKDAPAPAPEPYSPTPPSASDTKTRASAFEYDPVSGLLVKEIVEPSDSNLCVVTVYEYDAFGNKKTSTTRNCNGAAGNAAPHNSEAPAPSGEAAFTARVNTTAYADGRFATSAGNAEQHSETRTFNAINGAVTSVTGPNGLTTSTAYDALGRKTLEQRADGNGTRWVYEYCSGVASGTAACSVPNAYPAYVVTAIPVRSANVAANTWGAPNGAYTKTYFDRLNRAVRTETQGFDGTLVYQDTLYNALGQAAQQSRPYFAGANAKWTVTTYDLIGRIKQVTTPDGGWSKKDYDGLTTTITSRMAAAATPANGLTEVATVEKRDAAGQTIEIVDSHGKRLLRGYDALGNLTSTQDAAGNLTVLSYDLRGRKVQMQDPDMGTWTYAYNAAGDLVRQTNPKQQAVTMEYDRLARMTKRTEADLVSVWRYDTTYSDESACNKAVGKLCEASTTNGYRRRHAYDPIGRPISTTTTVGGTPFIAKVSYDTDGRVDSQTYPATTQYPSGLQVRNVYTALGYLQKVTNAAGTAAYWTANTLDAEGHFTEQVYANGMKTVNKFDAASGRIERITTSLSSVNAQELVFGYDYLGNLRSRMETVTAVTASYDYDALGRLRTESRSGGSVPAGGQTLSWTYDDIGNITSRSDIGTYTYPSQGNKRPHAVASVAGNVNGVINPSYTYDANGNLVSGGGRTAKWTSFDKAESITRGDATLAWLYDAEHERVQETYKRNGSLQRTTIYLNPGAGAGLYFEQENGVAGLKQKHYINAVGGTVAVVTCTATSCSTQYWHKDQQGSVSMVTNEAGTVIERQDYEPFGKRRYANGLSDVNGNLVATSTDRGYTGHEMLDEIGLVNMNGRIYDAALSRFMSADPFISRPGDLQDYNRYSYVANNPFFYTDPSGFKPFWKKKWFLQVASIVVAYYTGYVWNPGAAVFGAGTVGGGIVSGAVGGFAGGFVASGGSFDAALQGAFSGAMFGGIGAYGSSAGVNWGTAQFVAAHAVAGCVSAEASGGKCGTGALTSGVAKFATINQPGWLSDTGSEFGNHAAGTLYAAAVGGTVSVIGGGKFSNGAQSGAFAYLFNHLISIGANVKVPLVGGAKFSIGVSYEKGEWDAGVIIDSDVPTLNAGKMLYRATADISYQTGDFQSNHGSKSLTVQAGAKAIGGSLQRSPSGVTGGGVSFGPQLGLEVSAQQTRTISARYDIAPVIQRAADRVRSWFSN